MKRSLAWLALPLIAVLALAWHFLNQGARTELPAAPLSAQEQGSASVAKLEATDVQEGITDVSDPQRTNEFRATAPVPAATEEQRWLAETTAMCPDEIEVIAEGVSSQLSQASNPVFELFRQQGRYEVIPSNSYTGSRKDNKLVWQLSGGGPSGEMRKTVLPEDEYPELYALHRKWSWLKDRAQVVRTELRTKVAAQNPR